NLTLSTPGTYNICVTVTDANSCTVTDCETVVITGISESHGLTARLYPNPVLQILYAEIEAEANQTLVVTATDMQGRVVMSETRQLAAGSNLLAFNTAMWHSGIYQVRITGGLSSITAKVLKVK